MKPVLIERYFNFAHSDRAGFEDFALGGSENLPNTKILTVGALFWNFRTPQGQNLRNRLCHYVRNCNIFRLRLVLSKSVENCALRNEKFLSPSKARHRKKIRTHLSCVCAYTSLEEGDLSSALFMYFLGPAKTALTIFFKLCIPLFLDLKKNWGFQDSKTSPSGLKLGRKV